jgi:hypothetical protein
MQVSLRKSNVLREQFYESDFLHLRRDVVGWVKGTAGGPPCSSRRSRQAVRTRENQCCHEEIRVL